jgi:hypothetical protein
MAQNRLGWDAIEHILDDVASEMITSSTTYASRNKKRKAIIYGTAAYSTIDPATYPDGVIYIQYST